MASKNFFDLIRSHFPKGKLTQEQVDGMNAIIAGFAIYGDGDLAKLAYILATAKWETNHTMQPIVEMGAKSYFNKYEPGTKIGKNLGNTQKGDGYKFRGQGLAMLTGRSNYAYWAKRLGLPLLDKPELVREMDTSVRILIEGSMLGTFTGKALSDFIDGVDESDDEDLREYIEGRRVINGTDRAQIIGESALVFEHALREAAEAAPSPAPVPLPEPATTEPEQPPAEAKPAIRWGRIALVVGLVVAAVWFLFF